MSSLPFTSQQCFFVAVLVFIVIGFQRGWRRELITLIFVLLAIILIRPSSNGGFIAGFFARIPALIAYLFTGSTGTAAATSTRASNFLGPWGTLLEFIMIVALGYIIGQRAFPKPATPAERFIGIVPSVISGAFILAYLTTGNFFAKNQQGQSFFSVVVQPPDPTNYISVIFVIAVIAVVVGLIAGKVKKAAPPAKK